MKMFSPFAYRADETPPAPSPSPAPAAEPAKDELAELRAQMAAMQEQLAALAKK